MKMEDFATVGEVIKENRKLITPDAPELAIWMKFRGFLNDKLKLRHAVEHIGFEILMFIVVIVNSVVLIMIMLEPDEQTDEVLSEIDQYLVYIYLVEFI